MRQKFFPEFILSSLKGHLNPLRDILINNLNDFVREKKKKIIIQ